MTVINKKRLSKWKKQCSQPTYL